MNEVPENSVILFEDIDCVRAGHRRVLDRRKRSGRVAAKTGRRKG